MADRLSRREVIAGAGVTAMALSGPGFAHPASVARGVVFEGRRGDRRRRPDDPGNVPRKSWLNAVASARIWQSPLPPRGAHVVQVRTSDEYGREHVTRAAIEVTRSPAMPSAPL